MAEHIPFAYGAEDCNILKKLYADSSFVRISLQTHGRTLNNLPPGPRIWVDAGVDGLHKWKPRRTTKSGEETQRYEAYDEYIKQFPGHNRIGDPDFQSNPHRDRVAVKEFVESILDACSALPRKPAWISVPQLPMVNDSRRNKINRLLAQNAAEWKRTRRYAGKLILPVIFTDRKQVALRALRKGQLAEECYKEAGAQGIWVVDSKMDDQEGSGTLEKRFQDIIRFHQELAESNSTVSDATRVAGPYWGLNLVLWARGLIHYPAIGLGSAYRYYIPGFTPTTASRRLAIPSLRRWVLARPELKEWLRNSLTRMVKRGPSFSEFESLSKSLDQILRMPPQSSRLQVAKFYKRWFDGLAAVPPSGRALAFYQDLSKAFVIGRSLPSLPRAEKNKRPDRVAQQLMLNCL